MLCCFFFQHINEEAVLEAVSFEKDVDGFHPINVGTLCMQGRKPLFVSCTPKGCIELLVRSGVQMKGKRAVVIGRSNIVGTPAAQLLQVLSHLPHARHPKVKSSVICKTKTLCKGLVCLWHDSPVRNCLAFCD